jgi:hypothetical protein
MGTLLLCSTTKIECIYAFMQDRHWLVSAFVNHTLHWEKRYWKNFCESDNTMITVQGTVGVVNKRNQVIEQREDPGQI